MLVYEFYVYWADVYADQYPKTEKDEKLLELPILLRLNSYFSTGLWCKFTVYC